ncbi:hypothetical protein [Nannocystis pusilla]|uniref:hypothetical protein n=1 Tax=Nannocystis pusilla TaxID=889268 RepID=UPI003B7AFC90
MFGAADGVPELEGHARVGLVRLREDDAVVPPLPLVVRGAVGKAVHGEAFINVLKNMSIKP